MFLRKDLIIEDSNYKSERIKNLSFFLSGWTCIPFRGFSIYVVRHWFRSPETEQIMSAR